MSQLQEFELRRIYYHSEIIEESHRDKCYTCETAFFLIKDIAKTIKEEKKE